MRYDGSNDDQDDQDDQDDHQDGDDSTLLSPSLSPSPSPSEMVCTATGKHIYSSQKLARRAAAHFKARKNAHFPKKEPVLQSFFCKFCDGWHIGHKQGTNRAQYRRKMSTRKQQGHKKPRRTRRPR